MHKYLITAKCSFQNVRVCKHSVWFVTDSRGSSEMRSSQLPAPEDLPIMGQRQCRAELSACQCSDAGRLENPSEPGLGVSGNFTKSRGWQDHHSHSCLLFNQVFGGHPGPTRILWRKRQRRGVGRGERTVGTQGRRGTGCWLARRQPSLLLGDFVCIMTSCKLHCYFSQHHSLPGHPDHPGPSWWPLIKRKKKPSIYILPSELLRASLLGVALFSWYFPLVSMTLRSVTSAKCVFSKRKFHLENSSQFQFFLPKSVPQSCSTIWSYFCVNVGKRRKFPK